jgi:hypothetical protein
MTFIIKSSFVQEKSGTTCDLDYITLKEMVLFEMEQKKAVSIRNSFSPLTIYFL